jgi:hypothetical protein
MNNLSLNPHSNQVLNPVYMKSLLPSHPTWNGLYLFNKNNEIFGYISMATQEVMICFSNKGEWNGYFVKAGNSIYNFFNVTGIWTGMFLCPDNSRGFNLFDNTGKWTGIHAK